MGCCPPVREDNPIALASGLKLVDYLTYRRSTSFSEWIIVSTGGQQRKEENDRRNHFMINLHESMGPDRDRTRDHCRSRGREFDPGPVPYFRGD